MVWSNEMDNAASGQYDASMPDAVRHRHATMGNIVPAACEACQYPPQRSRTSTSEPLAH